MTSSCLDDAELAEAAALPSSPLPARAPRRVLFVSYLFPPVGGVGVQRAAKFVKYLREFGWEATVLMASNPSVPVIDESLCSDLPDDLIIAKARTWEPEYATKQKLADAAATGKSSSRSLTSSARRMARKAAGLLLQPDAQVLWIPSALRAGADLLRRLPHRAIFATAPPFSNFLLGTMLKKRSGLPLILDYRDEWDHITQHLENAQRDWFSRTVQDRMQRSILRQADAIVATTRGSTARLLARARQAGSQAHAHCIYNGYDPVDFERGASTPAPVGNRGSRFRLVYTGTLWNLTSVAPLVAAIERLRQKSPDMLERLELVFVGRKKEAQRELLARIAAAGCSLQDADFCHHQQAIDLMLSADGLCLLQSDVPGVDRIVNAKLFEYLAAGKPVLAIAPDGEMPELVRRFHPEGHFLPADTDGIANWMVNRVQELGRQPAGSPIASRNSAVAEFDRRHGAKRLAELLDRLGGTAQ